MCAAVLTAPRTEVGKSCRRRRLATLLNTVQAKSSDLTRSVPPSRDINRQTGYFGNHLSAEIQTMITNYRPRHLSPVIWKAVRDFVVASVVDRAPTTPRTTRTLLNATAQYVAWAWETAGWPLDETIFDSHNIERFLRTEMLRKDNYYRNRVRVELNRYVVAYGGESVPMPSFKRQGEHLRPYSAVELRAFRTAALGTPTPKARRRSLAILALGAGAGLYGREIADAQVGDIVDDGNIIRVHVAGSAPRVVPVRAEWVKTLRELTSNQEPADRVIGTAGKEADSARTRGLARYETTRTPNPRRLRTTWVAALLNDGVPLNVAHQLSGLRQLEFFARYIGAMAPVDPATVEDRIVGKGTRR